jgi:hypothetical protein
MMRLSMALAFAALGAWLVVAPPLDAQIAVSLMPNS